MRASAKQRTGRTPWVKIVRPKSDREGGHSELAESPQSASSRETWGPNAERFQLVGDGCQRRVPGPLDPIGQGRGLKSAFLLW